MNEPRIALFACTYDEVDGVANTVRHFERYAAMRNLPLLLIHGGFDDRDLQIGTVRRMEFRRKFPKFAVDKKHDFDLLFWRYYERAESALREYRPDIIHITGPSDVGLMGALLAHRLKIPLAASWHTNLHEYAEQRAKRLLAGLPGGLREVFGAKIRQMSLVALARFYHIPRILFAPNHELMDLLQRLTGKQCHLMSRGVDTKLFSPARRVRREAPFTIGYVGRITVEKSVGRLIDLEQELLNSGIADFRFMIVGQGALEPHLREKLTRADFTGVLHGEKLAEAYAGMDAFVFPSRTDTFGNVVLEALASGVPAIVSDSGGPRFIVRHEETGFVVSRSRDFSRYLSELMANPEMRQSMSLAARNYALSQSWDAVFDRLFGKYSQMLTADTAAPQDFPTVRRDFSSAGAAP
ncbi:MAG: glycosyltransferase [Acidobacteria bacterium]|nr:glycosyltransferase [Acidobacteriota bacterium]